MDINRKPLRISFIVVGCVAVALLPSSLASGFEAVQVAAYCTEVVVCALAALILTRRLPVPQTAEFGIIVSAFMVLVATAALKFVLHDDPIYRARAHASLVFWKSLPPVFGFAFLPSAIFDLWTYVVDYASLEFCRIYHGDQNTPRMHLTSLALTIGFMAVAWMNSGRLCSIYDAQAALAVEKSLMEAIITMMCDAMVWLSEDGSTILRTDQRFQMILGRSVIGEALGASLAPEELQRLQESISNAKTAPLLLPTTLLTASGVRIPVDMFIVGGRDASHATNKNGPAPAYLIGVRTTSRQGTESLCDAEMRQEHVGRLAASYKEGLVEEALPEDMQSALSSMPETTVTGRIFDRVDINRWLEGTSDDRAEQVRLRLERVVALGQSERWLMSSSDVKIAAGEILGAGSFGVVCGGWLHGSPVAVKTTRHSADSANVEHLVAIANEIRILRHVRHPNIVLFHGACVESVRGEVMLVLERVKGPDLHQYVKEHAADTEIYRRFQLLLDVACALRYLHGQSPRVVHGDLKDSNILVECSAPRAKLVDFGLSRLLTKGVRPLGGTLDWMAPEIICRSTTRPQPSADVFSFGRLAYLVIACKRPLEGIRRNVILDMAKTGAVHTMLWQEDRPLHRECRSMCDRLLRPTPELRPGMAEVHQEASAWRLPNLEAQMPALELACAEEGSRAAGNGAGLAGTARSLREALSSALLRHAQAVPAADAAGTAGGATTAASPTGRVASPSPPVTEARRELLLPWRKPTEEFVKKLMVMDMLMTWNCRAPAGYCCKYHANVAELQRIGAVLMSTDCTPMFQPHEQYQCPGCGVMDVAAQPVCVLCDKQTSWACSLASITENEDDSNDASGPSATKAAGAGKTCPSTIASL